MPRPNGPLRPPRGSRAFTLPEILVSLSILVLLVAMLSQIFRNAAQVTLRGNRHLDTDGEARQILDRMALDFSRIVKRADVDYYLKSPSLALPGNDRIAFYGEAAGYYTETAFQSPLSLIAYRIDGHSRLQRMGKGLLWNGASSAEPPMVFLPLTLAKTWPAVAATDEIADYETLGPDTFRLEYYYLLQNGSLSLVPWDAAAGHTAPGDLADLAAITVVLAVADPAGRALLSDGQAASLAAALPDFAPGMKDGDLEKAWRKAVDASPLPPQAVESVRIYRRSFYLLPTGAQP